MFKKTFFTLGTAVIATTIIATTLFQGSISNAQDAEGATSVEGATSQDEICAVYITGIGCPHCAKTDPVLFEQKLQEHPNLTIIEYEIYQQSENATMLLSYDSGYNSGMGIPLMIFDETNIVVGDGQIVKSIEGIISQGGKDCPLLTGSTDIENLDINSLPKNPKIWRGNRILIANGKTGDSEILREILLADDLGEALEGVEYTVVEAKDVAYSGGYAEFDNAVKIDGWIFQWKNEGGEIVEFVDENVTVTKTDDVGTGGEETGIEVEKLTLTKLISLSLVDAINPCALAVLTLMLVAILSYDPTKKKKILLAGLAFTLSVFIMYLIYGLIIIRFFQLVQAITSVRLILYKILGGVAVLLGILNIRDTLFYKAGGLGTEMPMFMRPRLKKIISKVTSPKGAFVVGLFVTVFLLPCTIGPYVIAGGILSTYDIVKTIPPLLLYNAIFVAPMIIITGIVYFGITRVENVSEWKDKNIRILHLVAGIIMAALGVAMLLGWV